MHKHVGPQTVMIYTIVNSLYVLVCLIRASEIVVANPIYGHSLHTDDKYANKRMI